MRQKFCEYTSDDFFRSYNHTTMWLRDIFGSKHLAFVEDTYGSRVEVRLYNKEGVLEDDIKVITFDDLASTSHAMFEDAFIENGYYNFPCRGIFSSPDMPGTVATYVYKQGVRQYHKSINPQLFKADVHNEIYLVPERLGVGIGVGTYGSLYRDHLAILAPCVVTNGIYTTTRDLVSVKEALDKLLDPDSNVWSVAVDKEWALEATVSGLVIHYCGSVEVGHFDNNTFYIEPAFVKEFSSLAGELDNIKIEEWK